MTTQNPTFQNPLAPAKIGEVLHRLNFVRNTQIKRVLEEQQNLSGRWKRFRLGELLLFRKIINPHQLETALRVQRQSQMQQHTSSSAKASRLYKGAVQEMQRSKYERTFWSRVEAHLSLSPVLQTIRSLFTPN